MKTYKLELPPARAGVYAIRNNATKKLYIGQTTDLLRRMNEWRAIARGSLGGAPAAARAELTASDISDLEYIVLQEMPGATNIDLLKAEAEMIAAVRKKHGPALLNAEEIPVAPPPRKARNIPGIANTAASKITYAGKQISYPEARELLGVRAKTLQKRLAKYREKGVMEVSVEDLLARGVGNTRSYTAQTP